MSWSISTRNLKAVGSFAAAEKVWNDADPWKSEHTSWRPLDGWRMRHKRIVKLSDERGYECVLFDTPIVTYYADGSVKLVTYDSHSTQIFAWYVKPSGCRPISHGGAMYWEVDTVNGPHYQQETMVVAPTGKPGCWTVTNPAKQETERVYDPKAGAEVRKLLKPYCAWHELTARLKGKTRFNNYAVNDYEAKDVISQLLRTPYDAELYPHIMATDYDLLRIRQFAYELRGVHRQQLVPHDKLPRISR